MASGVTSAESDKTCGMVMLLSKVTEELSLLVNLMEEFKGKKEEDPYLYAKMQELMGMHPSAIVNFELLSEALGALMHSNYQDACALNFNHPSCLRSLQIHR